MVLLKMINDFVSEKTMIGIFRLGLYSIAPFGKTRFKWLYIYKSSKNTMKLCKGGKAFDDEEAVIIKSKRYDGVIRGSREWDDVEFDKVSFITENADVEKVFYNLRGDVIDFENPENQKNEVSKMRYKIIDRGNSGNKMVVNTSLNYDDQKMEPVFYVEIQRPVIKFDISLIVEEEVPVTDIAITAYEKVTLSGEKTYLFQKKVLKARKKDDQGYTEYRYSVRYPKLFHVYEIKWRWTR